MPKKTKKQKIISEYRKKMHALSSSDIRVSPVTIPQTPTSMMPSAISLPTITSHPSPPIREEQSFVGISEFTAIKKDLLSTLLITTIILLGEFVIARYIRF